MTHAEDFCRDYQGVLDGLDLPLRISLSYEPASLLAERDGRSVWKLRRRCDGAPFVLKVSSGEEELEAELRLLTRLYPALAGAVPLAADCFAQGGRCFLVRSYLPGRTLAQLREEAGGCTEAQCVSIGRQACALLERLHTLEPPVIQRDIKPENIVLGEDGTLGLIDFGIARQYKPERDADTRLMGSRSTAPPEQYGFAQTDGRADLYALGITLIWLLTGSYEREALEKAPVSRRLKRVLAKATAFSPAGRYPTAAALGRALRGSGAGRGLRIALAAAACAALCLGLGGLALSQHQGAQIAAFSSACLEEAVRAELDMPDGPLTYTDLERVERLALVGEELLGEGQEYGYLQQSMVDWESWADVPQGDVSDLSLLSHMPNLTELCLAGQAIDDLAPLAELELEVLILSDNQITDLTPLAGLGELDYLLLWPPRDGALEAALGLERLAAFDLGDAQLEDLSSLAGCPVEDLRVHNQLNSLEGVGALPNLRNLALYRCALSDLSPLADCTGLESICLSGLDNVDDFSVLSSLPWLQAVVAPRELWDDIAADCPGYTFQLVTE